MAGFLDEGRERLGATFSFDLLPDILVSLPLLGGCRILWLLPLVALGELQVPLLTAALATGWPESPPSRCFVATISVDRPLEHCTVSSTPFDPSDMTVEREGQAYGACTCTYLASERTYRSKPLTLVRMRSKDL